MEEVSELRVALTVADFDEAVAFYRDAIGLEQLADWSGEDGRVIILAAGRATLEIFDQVQAEKVDAIEAGVGSPASSGLRWRSRTAIRSRGDSLRLGLRKSRVP
jgi:catechol 2,3-dioxygenase-like lactoylglutathione lyase family enzyme